MASSQLNPKQLATITRETLRHYDERAAAFWEGTRDHDVTQNRQALLDAIESRAPCRILDLGCGPGRDLLAFREQGHRPVGLDGSRQLCRMARAHSGCEVWEQNMVELDLPAERFDGVFANASLFHVPVSVLPSVLEHLWETLVPGGVLFASNPRGDNTEGWHGDRYGAYHDLQGWRSLVSPCGFEEVLHYYRPPGMPRHLQPWLATVFRKCQRSGRPTPQGV